MKKLIFTLFIFVFCITPVLAKNNIYSIDMDIYLDEYGNANIKEIWQVKGSDGTEWYKGYGNVGNMKLSNFTVSMDNHPLTYKKWNVNESLNAKKGYYGVVNKTDGYELCFGKYDYNKHTFILEYTLSNVIFNTLDAQVLYNTFIDRLSDVNFENYSIEISSYYSFPDTLDVWGFGYKGYAYVENGKIKMSNEGKMGSQYAVLLAKFPSNTFKTNNKYSEFSTFDSVLKKAEEGSYKHNYSSSNLFSGTDWMFILAILFTILPMLVIFIFTFVVGKIQKRCNFDVGNVLTIIVLSIILFPALISNPLTLVLYVIFVGYLIMHPKGIYGYRNNKKIKKKEVPYFRDIPCHDIYYANALLYLNNWNKNDSNIIGAIYLKWIRNHLVEVKKDEKGKTKLLLKRGLVFQNKLEERLYNILLEASKDDILEDKELERWARRHYSEYLSLAKKLNVQEVEKLKINGSITQRKDRSECKHKWIMDDKIYEDSIKLYGLKKFLLHFSNIKEKEAIEVKLWDVYLLFAYLFGIADKVSKQFKKLYPEVIEEMNHTIGVDFDTLIWLNHISIRSVSAASSARSAAEAARNYSSGGGGFSSGGGGGGSFGGGGGGGSR